MNADRTNGRSISAVCSGCSGFTAIPDPSSNPAAIASRVQLAGETAELEKGVHAVLQELPERERVVVKLHYGVGQPGPLTLAQIGEHLGITRERVRQIESQALRRLRGDNRIRRTYVELASA